MAKEVGKIKIGMYVDSDELADSIDQGLGKAEGKSAGRVGAFFKKMALAGGAAIATTAAKSLFDFSGFERSMNEVFTLLPGISKPAMDQMTDQVKDFAKEFGVLPEKVVPALYQSLSAGVPPDNVFAFLETAQKAAKGGVTDLTTAVDGISSVVNAYGADAMDASKASDLMFTAVRLGKTNFSELSASIFNVTPTAAALGVKFGDVTAALAAMTAQGVPTSVATTQLRQLFVELSKAGTDTSKVFEKVSGKSFKDFIAGGGNTQQALQLLERHAKDTGVGINDLFGSVEAGSAALALTGGGTDKFTDALKGMEDSAGATQGAFDRMDTGIGPIWDRLKARAKVALLDVGQRIVDFGRNVVAGFKGEGLGEFAGRFEEVAVRLGEIARGVVDTIKEHWPRIRETVGSVIDFIRDNATPVLAGLGVIVAATLVPAVASLAGAVAAVFSPVVLVVGALALLVAGVVYAYQNFEGFRKVVDAVAGFLVDTVWPKIQQFASFIAEQFGNLVGWVREHWGQIREAIGHVIEAVRAVIEGFVAFVQMLWRTFGDEILNIARIVWDQIRNVVETAVGIVRGVIVTVLSLINGDWGKAWDAIKGILSTAWEFIRETAVNGLRLLREIVEAGISGLVAYMREVPGRILEALGDLGSLLLGAGRNLIEGLISGIKNMAKAAADAAWGVVKGAAKAAWDAVVPGSPSKVGRAIGQNFGQGIAAGILDGSTWVQRSATSLMDDAIKEATAVTARLGLPPAPAMRPAAAVALPSSSASFDVAGPAAPDMDGLAERFAAALAANPTRAYVVASDVAEGLHRARTL